MNRNIENYKKTLDEIKASDKLKEKTINKIMNAQEKNRSNYYVVDRKNKTSKFGNLKVATYSLCSVLMGAILVFGTFLLTDNQNELFNSGLAKEEFENNDTILLSDVLPKVNTMENLNNLIGDVRKNLYQDLSDSVNSNIKGEAISSSDVYSKTNVQVEGIDEADIIKTDGNYIYYIANQKVYIVDVKDAKNAKIESVLTFEKDMRVSELYINDNKMVVILQRSDINAYKGMNESLICYDVISYDTETIVITYDLRSRTNPTEKRRIEIDGSYENSRMINDEIYVITNKSVRNTEEENILPTYKDTVKDDEKHSVELEEMLYTLKANRTNYTVIVGFSVNNNIPANIKTILGPWGNIYCTQDNLYITCTGEEIDSVTQTNKSYTDIYKFKLQKTNVVSTAVGRVEGHSTNQFGIGEHNGNLSVVTSQSFREGNANWKTQNNLYVLNENLEQIGALEDFSKDEPLYAVRFMGDKAFVVTFKQIDPLFVIDLSIPTEPRVLGELKIPGYSNYLHPYDETHIIGIGQETETVSNKNGTRTEIKGVKVSLFDVSDYTNPKEVQSLVINNKSYTIASYEYKAILFSKERNLLAFPLSSSEGNENKQEYVILSVDLENGITLKNKVNHGYTVDEFGKYMNRINRGVYINNNLFTASNQKILVTSLEDYETVSEILL